MRCDEHYFLVCAVFMCGVVSRWCVCCAWCWAAQKILEAMSAGVDFSMAGQFAACFLSAYLVSDKVCVVSLNNDDEQFIWESAAGVSFTVQKDTEMFRGEVKRGTNIIFFLKEDQSEFSEERRLKDLVFFSQDSSVSPSSCTWRNERRRQ